MNLPSAVPQPAYAPSDQDGLARPRLRLGIRAKLAVAIAIVAVLTAVAAALSWRSYSELERLLANVTGDNLPQVATALKLSEATAKLAAGAPALDDSRSQFQRQSNFIALQQQTERLRNLIEALEERASGSGKAEELRAFMGAIVDNIADRNVLVERSISLSDTVTRLALDMEAIGEQARRYRADPTAAPLADALAALREGHLSDQVSDLANPRSRFELHARRLADALPKASPGAAELARRVLALGHGAEGVFEVKAQALLTRGRLAAAGEEGRDLVARTSAAVGRLVAEAESEAAANQARAEETIADGRRTLLIAAVATVLGPLLFVWLYIGRNIVGRLAGLAKSMHRIVEGDLDTPVPRSGDDELTDMADELAVFRDALLRLKESTTALQESERRLKTILDTSPLALAISRVSDHAFLYANPRWCETYGYPEAEVRNLRAIDLYADGSDRERLVAAVRSQGFASNFECRVKTAGGPEMWVMLSATMIEMDGEPAVIVSTSDITRRKEEEAALAAAKRAAEDASQAKSLFLATMSHEIRTPMNGVLTMAQLLEDMNLSGEQREMARVIRDSANSLLTIINDILDFSKIEAGRLLIEQVPMSPVEVAEGVAELLAPRALDKGIGLVSYVDPKLPERVVGDPVRVRQVITNLAGNAVKFTDKGCVRIAIEAVDPAARPLMLRVTVTDTGIGLDREAQEKLFEPFIQADASIQRRFGGTGLGLSICRRLVAMMGGEIGVESALGHGSTFWFTLPVEVVEEENEKAPDLAGIAVLVLAEGAEAAEGVRRYLAHLKAQVAVVGSTDAALAAVRAAALAGWSYDVVLVDGAQDFRLRVSVARALLAAAGADAKTRVVMVAPHATYSSAASEARVAGLFATIAKPIRRWALWRTVAAAVGRGFLEIDEVRQGSVESYVAPSVEEAAAGGALILVAEDNHTNQVVIRRLMERLGYAIEIVANGLEAWERMQIRDYGLLLTDCHMPEMDGYDLTARVRQWEQETMQRIPIVALTADAMATTARKCQECGMDAFLAKPVDLAQLDATVSRLLPRAVALRRRRVGDLASRPDGGQASAEQAPPPEAEPGRPPVLDLTAMEQIFGSINDDAKELLALFVDSTRPLVEDIERNLTAANTEGAREAAHSAKGAGNSAGAFRFARLCAEIEIASRDGDSEVAGALVEPMKAAFAEAAEAIEKL